MYSQKMKNPYIGWRKEIFSLMELRYMKNQKEIRKINQAYRKVKKEHMKHSREVERYFRKKCCFKYGLPKPEYEGKEKKEIYLVFSFAPESSMARAIAAYTNSNFSHVSLALDESLKNMYSFTIRKGTNFSGIEGGFTYERLHDYQAQRLWIQVNGIYVTKAQYERIMNGISTMAKEQKQTSYNLKGLIEYVLEEERPMNPKDMFCSEFIMYLFEQAGVNFLNQKPELTSPQDLANACADKCGWLVYRGNADWYRRENQNE